MRGLLAGWLIAAALTGDALAAPVAERRVVLADPDPELRHAIAHALAPWHLEVVLDSAPPADVTTAKDHADRDTARFVVWRDGDQLVVYDRALGTAERRDSRSGVLDPPTAAAAALTIKTMMRLPPPPDEPADPALAAAPGLELRVQLGVATWIAHGDTTRVAARLGGAVTLRPWASSGWRFGVAGDRATSTSVSRAGFTGAWHAWAVLAIASWTYARDAWALEPYAALGLQRSTLDGTEMNTARTESATLAAARVGAWARRRIGRWTLGGALDVERVFGTPTYSKVNAPAEVFQVPGLALGLGAVIAIDL